VYGARVREVTPQGRETFGPPKQPLGAFFWALAQVPRAVWWQLREKELRGLAVAPALITLALGIALTVAAILAAEPILTWWSTRSPGVLGQVTWIAERVVLTVVLLIGAALTTWQLQGAIAAASLERMTLCVQRIVNGQAPPPTVGPLQVVKRAARSLFPRTKQLVAWVLSTLAALTLIAVPVVGPVLVVGVQASLGALFLAHGAITDNRERLGLPRKLLLKEPALVLGLAVALAPLILFPPAMILSGGPVAIAGTLVALGTQRRGE
jgi:uncharacterized protein involved in cysteine biosynthesis